MTVTFDISVSLDGYIAGPDQGAEHPLGRGGEQLHEWVVRLASWRESHGLEGGETDTPSDAIMREAATGAGAVIMGRNMFSPTRGPWEGDWRGWWGDEPPFHVPVYVLTHHAREPLEMAGGTTFHFVTDGPEAALEAARSAAGEQRVSIGGGAQTVQQYLRLGAVDEFQLHVVPVFLGGGERLFVDMPELAIERVRVVDTPQVTHMKYRVVR
jgi:dihydrofolate reductase